MVATMSRTQTTFTISVTVNTDLVDWDTVREELYDKLWRTAEKYVNKHPDYMEGPW